MWQFEQTQKVMQEFFAIHSENREQFEKRIQYKIDNNKKAKVTKENNEKKKKYLDFVYLTQQENDKLIEEFWYKNTMQLIFELNNFIGSRWDKYKSHYFTIVTWAKKKNLRKPEQKIEVVEEIQPEISEEHKQKIRENMQKFISKVKIW